jgi:hypothetical protein
LADAFITVLLLIRLQRSQPAVNHSHAYPHLIIVNASFYLHVAAANAQSRFRTT